MVRRLLFPLVLIAGLAGMAAPAASAASAAMPEPAAGLLAPLSAGERIDLPALDGRVPRPDAFLGYPLGSRFTHWDRILDYLRALDAASDRVTMWEYGYTYEGRPLELLAVSAPENLARLDEIRRERLRLAEPEALSKDERERLAKRLPAVVWLAYGVHGNESSSAEAAMAVAYVLAAAQGETAAMLDGTIVLVDPLVNPDGRERYVNGFEQRRGRTPNPSRSAAEHWEPWPGGRQNHYLLDLNRDWAWASQQETRYRLAAYREWEPQVYVDFHEMSSESSYFFPPAAEPVHPRIARRIVSWLDTFGRGNAAAFDRQGWVYFKGESYDLFYPGYGDSYPGLRGAVGMTYEMAGGGRAGQALRLPDGSHLTLADRVARHFTASLATFRTAAASSRRLLEDFVANRLDAAQGGPARSYLWRADQQEARTLAELLELHGVRVRRLGAAADLKVRGLRGGAAEGERHFAAGTWVVSTAQPLGNLVEALMENDSRMSERFVERQRQRLEQNLSPEFYDITAWSLPLAYNVETWTMAGEPGGTRAAAGSSHTSADTSADTSAGGLSGSGELGVLVPPQGLGSYRLAARLQARKVLYRVALRGFSAAGAAYSAGTLFVPRYGNPADLEEVLAALLRDDRLRGVRIASSYEVEGLSLGSNEMVPVRPARVGLLSGEGVDPTSFGFLWHLLDRQIELAHERLDLARLDDVDLGELDVLVFPDGDYEERIGEKLREKVDGWAKAGGVVVAIGGAVSWLQEHEITTVKKWEAPEKDPESPDDDTTGTEGELAKRPIFTPGAALATSMRSDHPLTLGLEAPPVVLVEGTTVLKATGDPQQDVLVAAEETPVVAGFAFPEAEQRLAGSLLVGMERRGAGSLVLFAQEPAFRLFWRATTPILLNALLYGPSTGVGGRY